MEKAYKQVKKNGGSGGVDGMGVKEFGQWFARNRQELQRELQQETYSLQAVRGIQIPKPKGGQRELGIPTVKDRVVQQAINQVLQPITSKTFSQRHAELVSASSVLDMTKFSRQFSRSQLHQTLK